MGFKIEGLENVSDDDAAVSDLLTSDQAKELDWLPEAAGYAQDPDPGYAAPGLDGLFPDLDKPAGRRVSVTTRKDIRGKIAMMLLMAGSGWSARDPHCGGALLDSIPDRDTPEGPQDGIASAFADIVCDSPDMVKWFTTSGKYLKWLNLASALQPVLQTAFAHHVSHALVDDEETAVSGDWGRYAAS